MATFEDILKRLGSRERSRLLAFGSSNTEHFQVGMHWFDCLELAINENYGRVHTCINTGIGGDTAGKLLARFDEDAARYEPHLVIITVGGNDSFPENGVTPEQYKENLLELHQRFTDMNTAVIFQTYYAPDPDLSGPLERFYAFMDIMRKAAHETETVLVDHLSRWEPFRQEYPDLYKPLMRDAFHLNHRGNAVIGVDLARYFKAPLGNSDPDFWEEALKIQSLMDDIASA